MYHSGVTDNISQREVAIALCEATHLSLLKWEPISPQLARMRLRRRVHSLAVLAAHAPTLDADDATKDAPYMDAETVSARG